MSEEVRYERSDWLLCITSAMCLILDHIGEKKTCVRFGNELKLNLNFILGFLFLVLFSQTFHLFLSRFTICHKTEVVKNTLNPVWQAFKIPVRALCNGDYDR